MGRLLFGVMVSCDGGWYLFTAVQDAICYLRSRHHPVNISQLPTPLFVVVVVRFFTFPMEFFVTRHCIVAMTVADPRRLRQRTFYLIR